MTRVAEPNDADRAKNPAYRSATENPREAGVFYQGSEHVIFDHHDRPLASASNVIWKEKLFGLITCTSPSPRAFL
jgi:hypothetical protein